MFRHLILSALIFTFTSSLYARQFEDEWKARAIPKVEKVPRQETISHRSHQIKRKTRYLPEPVIENANVAMNTARRVRRLQKTQELITQLEGMVRQRANRSRRGELQMRLAELYFDRSVDTAAREGEQWEKQILAWEALSPERRKGRARPKLRTPNADRFRKQALSLYGDLAKRSRGRDQGRSKLIRRDEVLFFMGSTLNDLQKYKSATPYLRELSQKWPRSSRALPAQVMLSDIYFESNNYKQAIPTLLKIAANRQSSPEAHQFRTYALYKLGWSYMNTAAYGKSVMAFRRTLELARKIRNERKDSFVKESYSALTKAYALSGQYNQGEKFFSSIGRKFPEYATEFRRNAAEAARDRGHHNVANAFYDRIIKSDKYSLEARKAAMEQLVAYRAQGASNQYVKALDRFAKNYGASSKWMRKRESSQKALYQKELVDLMRSEAKYVHNLAQKQKNPALYKSAIAYYDVYFRNVPKPNTDTQDNYYGTAFYFGELLFKQSDYRRAYSYYSAVRGGKHKSDAAYAKLSSMQKLSEKDKRFARNYAVETQKFINENPRDPRVKALLYSGAFASFKSGSYKEALGLLNKLVSGYGGSKEGVEAAERILFILEKEKRFAQIPAQINQFQSNSALMRAGGSKFRSRLSALQSKSSFKSAEVLPERSKDDARKKSIAFYNIARSQKDLALKEKAYNNARVFAQKSTDKKLIQQIDDEFIRVYPRSKYASEIYLTKADSLLESGKWQQALSSYNSYLSGNKAKAPESIVWNKIFVESSLNNLWFFKMQPSSSLGSRLKSLVKNYLRQYPNSNNREQAAALIAYDRTYGKNDQAFLKSLPRMSSGARSAADEGLLTAFIRRASLTNLRQVAAQRQVPDTYLAREAIGEARFRLADSDYRRYRSKRIRYSPTVLAKSIKDKVDALTLLENTYLNVVQSKSGRWSLKSLDRLSSMYFKLADDIELAPGLSKADLQPFTQPLRDKAVSFLEKCVEVARTAKVGGSELASCRVSLASRKPSFKSLSYEILNQAKWRNVDRPRGKEDPLYVIAVNSFLNSKLGESELAVKVLEKKAAKLSKEELANINFIKGSFALERNNVSEATRYWAQLVNRHQLKNTASLMAARNLASLYNSYGDFDSTLSMARPLLKKGGVDAAYVAVAYAGKGAYSEAAKLYPKIVKRSSTASLWFNKALAEKGAGQLAKARQSLSQYISLQNPASNHVARTLLRQWGSK